MLHSITNYFVRFAIIMLPFLGISESQKNVDDVDAPAQELQIDYKKGNGLQPMNTHDNCNYCPPKC